MRNSRIAYLFYSDNFGTKFHAPGSSWHKSGVWYSRSNNKEVPSKGFALGCTNKDREALFLGHMALLRQFYWGLPKLCA